jgi:hypothetical protein
MPRLNTAFAEDVLHVEPKIWHRGDHHPDKVGPRLVPWLSEKLHEVVAHDGRIQQPLSSRSKSSFVDCVYSSLIIGSAHVFVQTVAALMPRLRRSLIQCFADRPCSLSPLAWFFE